MNFNLFNRGKSMIFLIVVGFVAIIAGIMFILFPNVLAGITDWTNRFTVNIDDMAFKHRIAIGISLILCAVFLWFIVYYVYAMPILKDVN